MTSDSNYKEMAMQTLSSVINEYLSFVKRTLNSQEFIDKIRDLLPFDEKISESMAVDDKYYIIPKMGITVMRIDFDPEMFTMAINITICRDDVPNKIEDSDKIEHHSIFINCGSISEIQNYIDSIDFKADALEQFYKAINREN